MITPTVYEGSKKLPLGKRLGKGGEGEVYQIDDGSGRAVKVYTTADALSREQKIEAMVRSGLADRVSFAAFPMSVVRFKGGQFAGFVMRQMRDYSPLHDLYSPKARKQNFPQADYQFLIRAGANIARAVASIHSVGCVIGDLNHSGILISGDARAALIDADSFQFQSGGSTYRCLVGVPEYTPPELQSRPLKDVVRTVNHDGFGVSTIIFQLLFMGRHPYMGAYSGGEMPLERAIAEHRFVYSRLRSVGMKPPPGICSLSDFPIEVGTAFETAFGSSAAQARPTAQQWIALLDGLGRSLKRCSTNTLHYYPSVSHTCPWCNLEERVGVILFVPYFRGVKGGDVADPGAAAFNLKVVWASIEAVRLPAKESLTPAIPVRPIEPSAAAGQAKSQRHQTVVFGVLALAAAAVILIYAPALWFGWIGLGFYGLSAVFAPAGSSKEFERKYVTAVRQWEQGLADWRKRCGLDELLKLKEELAEARASYEQLPSEHQRLTAKYQREREQKQKEAYLDRFQIRRYRIKGIGPAKEAALASYGIETAQDVVYGKIVQVPGFGPSTAHTLMRWRQRLEERFKYDPRPNDQDRQELGRIAAEIATNGTELRRKLVAGARDLRNAANACSTRAQSQDPQITRLYYEREQARADIEALGGTVPTVLPSPPTVSPRYPTRYPSPSPSPRTSNPLAGTPNCPRCGSRMVRRTARQGRNRGSQFWGCSRYPRCTGTRS